MKVIISSTVLLPLIINYRIKLWNRLCNYLTFDLIKIYNFLGIFIDFFFSLFYYSLPLYFIGLHFIEVMSWYLKKLCVLRNALHSCMKQLILRYVFITNKLASLNQKKLYAFLLVNHIPCKVLIFISFDFLWIVPNLLSSFLIFWFGYLFCYFKSTLLNYVDEISRVSFFVKKLVDWFEFIFEIWLYNF